MNDPWLSSMVGPFQASCSNLGILLQLARIPIPSSFTPWCLIDLEDRWVGICADGCFKCRSILNSKFKHFNMTFSSNFISKFLLMLWFRERFSALFVCAVSFAILWLSTVRGQCKYSLCALLVVWSQKHLIVEWLSLFTTSNKANGKESLILTIFKVMLYSWSKSVSCVGGLTWWQHSVGVWCGRRFMHITNFISFISVGWQVLSV